jgi:hypothetical protein
VSHAAAVRSRLGAVTAYATGSDLTALRVARKVVGRVTVSGRSGLRALTELERLDDLGGVDLDPAGYLDREPEQASLFEVDIVARQRELGLDPIRSPGNFVPWNDELALRAAFAGNLPAEVVRVVSLDGRWLTPPGLVLLLPMVANCTNPLALVLAACFDPLAHPGAVDGLQAVLDAATPGERRVELLRTDSAAVGFVAVGGSLATVGLTTTTRHHGLPLNQRSQDDFERRQSSPLVHIGPLNSWHRGYALGALAPFDGAGLTDCDCVGCDARDLLRFDLEFSGRVPVDVAADARLHDMYSWMATARDVLAADDPAVEWRRRCDAATQSVLYVASEHKIALTLPRSVSDWV